MARNRKKRRRLEEDGDEYAHGASTVPAPSGSSGRNEPDEPDDVDYGDYGDEDDQAGETCAEAIERIVGARLKKAVDHRRLTDEIMRENHDDYMGKARIDDTDDTGIPESVDADNIFVRLTRSKVRSQRARIVDALFGDGVLPFDTQPITEALKDFTDVVEDILKWQLEEGEWAREVKDAAHYLILHGTGVMVGPFLESRSRTTYEDVIDDVSLAQGFGTTTYDLPVFKGVNLFDYYPDANSPDEINSTGGTWVTRREPEVLLAEIVDDPSYHNLMDAIEEGVKILGSNEGSEEMDAEEADTTDLSRRVEIAHYIGLLPESVMDLDLDDEAPEFDEYDKHCESIAILFNGRVVKAYKSPYMRRPVYRCCYEFTPGKFHGVGLGENNRAQQSITNAAYRLYLVGKGYALLKTGVVDFSKFDEEEDFRRYPGKLYRAKDGINPEEMKTAIWYHDVEDVTRGWETVLQHAAQMSDDDSGVTKYTQGNDAKHMNQTASGISMIMNASSLPVKEVIQHIDDYWITPQIDSLLDWNLRELEPEVVEEIFGPEKAAKWAAIQELYRQHSGAQVMKWKATGATTFISREVMMTKLQGFLQVVLAHPGAVEMVDMRELLAQVWEFTGINKESVVLDEDALAKRREEAANQPSPEAAAQKEAAQERMAELRIKLEFEAEEKDKDRALKTQESERQARLDAEKLEVERMWVDIEEKKLRVMDAHKRRERRERKAS